MKSSKKPDGVAWDEESKEYISKLLPYATSNSSPVISIPNVDAFKKKGVDKVSKNFKQNSLIYKIKLNHLLLWQQTLSRCILLSLNLNPLLVKAIIYMLAKRVRISFR